MDLVPSDLIIVPLAHRLQLLWVSCLFLLQAFLSARIILFFFSNNVQLNLSLRLSQPKCDPFREAFPNLFMSQII